jgi:hypothetical protein
MHMFFLNIGPNWIKHLTGEFFKNDALNKDQPYLLSKAEWKQIGIEMDNAKKYIPSSFGRSTRNIEKYKGSFKSEEWSRFMLLYAVVLLEGKLEYRYLSKFANFAKAMQTATESTNLTLDDRKMIRKSCIDFYLHYEK